MAATAEAPSNTPRLLEVGLLIAAPLVVPAAWIAGVVLLTARRPPGWRTTLALCPLGIAMPLHLFTHGGRAGAALGVVSMTACLTAAWRLMNR